MKRLFLTSLLFIGITSSFAQQAKQNLRSKTIFECPNFQVGTIIQSFGATVKDTINIYLKDASLLFKRNGKIYQANTDKVIGVELDSVKYHKIGKQMARIVAANSRAMLLRVTQIDLKQYKEETQGGEDLPFFEAGDGFASNFFIELNQDKREEDLGVPIRYSFYFLIGMDVVPASASKIKKYVRADKKEAFKAINENRWWSWKNEENLKDILKLIEQ